MPLMNRRAALAVFGALAAGGAVGAVLRGLAGPPAPQVRLTNGPGGMGAADMAVYRDMFARHSEITRTVDEVPGGVRTTTE